MFWNVAGLRNKDKKFWEGLKEWDVLFLSETWTDERNWRGIRERLPEGLCTGDTMGGKEE